MTSVTVIEQANQTIYGLWMASSDNTIAKDISSLAEQYYQILGAKPKSVLPFFVLSQEYNPATKQFKLFIGGKIQNDKLEKVLLPQGEYGHIAVKPKFGFLWGPAIGEAKNHFYTKWLPVSNYQPLNMEYEHHTEKSTIKKPEIDLYFAIEKKT